jgi:CyaY protein
VEAAGDDIDSEINGGILSLEFADGSKVIVNRQTPLREIWVAAKSGGFHFRFDGATWRDTRSGEALDALLTQVIAQQSGRVIPITL